MNEGADAQGERQVRLIQHRADNNRDGLGGRVVAQRLRPFQPSRFGSMTSRMIRSGRVREARLMPSATVSAVTMVIA